MIDAIRRNRDISAILLLFTILALAYSVVNPLHEATDELRHYRFVRYIAAQGRLPVQGQEPCRSQSHHPPLFYALGAVATGWIDTGRGLCDTPPHNPFWAYRYADVGIDNKNQYLHGPDEAFPWHGEALAAHILRAINVLFGAGTVWLTWATGRVIWPHRRALAAGATAFVAFNPMFLYMSGAINNDVIAAFSGAAVLLACARLLRDPQGLSLRWGVRLGALYGLALMSKFNMAVVALLIAFAMTVVAWRKKQWSLWLRAAALSVLAAALIAGWWFVRNLLLYGEPTGFRTVTELWGMRDPRESLGLAILELPLAWSTLWGRFGFGQIPLPQPVYDGLAWLAFAGLTGVALGLWQRRRGAESEGGGETVFLALLALNVLVAFAVLFNYMLVSPAGAMGRFFFPGLPALALLIFFGLCVLARTGWRAARRLRHSLAAPGRMPAVVAALVHGGMFTLSLAALFGYLAPAYARPPSYPAGLEAPNEVNVQFSGLATLRGYDLSASQLAPGDPLSVDLYWEVDAQPPGNFLYFLHLTDSSGTLTAQRDTHPGTGAFPTAQWQEGDRFVDSLTVFIPETAYTPETLTVTLGLYAPTYRLAVTGPNGESLGDALELGSVALLPAEELSPAAEASPAGEDVPNPMRQNFQNELFLRGYRYEQRTLQAGETLAATLFWQRAARVERAYVAQLQLLDGGGAVQAQAELPLAPRQWPRPGLQETALQLALPADLAPGPYGVRLVLFDPQRNEPHHLIAPEGQITAQHLDLARIMVREGQP